MPGGTCRLVGVSSVNVACGVGVGIVRGVDVDEDGEGGGGVVVVVVPGILRLVVVVWWGEG